MLKNYLKIAFRNLFHNKVFTTINTVGLAIGMAATLLIFVWVQNELTFDNYHKDSDKIYRMITHLDVGNDVWNWAGVPLLLGEKALEEIPEIADLTKFRTLGEILLKTDRGAIFQEKQFSYIDENWLDIFDYEVLEGDPSIFQEKVFSIALTASKAEHFFGYKGATGQILTIDSVDYTVDLILKDNPSNSVFQFDGFIPLKARWTKKETLKRDQKWGDFNYKTFIKCKEGVNPKIVEEKLLAILETNRTDKKKKNNATISLEFLRDIRFSEVVDNDTFSHQNKSTVYIFVLIGLMLLFSASFNYVNLSTALINKRVKEIGVKKIIGASFKHIFTQLMIETILISLFSIFLAIAIAQFGLPFLQEITGLALQIDLTATPIWKVLACVLFLNIFVAGIYPAILFSGFKPIGLVKGKLLTQKGVTLRKGLVVTQFIVAIAMVMGMVVIQQQFKYIQEKNVGYERSYVVDINPNLFNDNWDENIRKFGIFKQEIETIPELEAVAGASGTIVNIRSSNGNNFKWEGQPENYNAKVFRFSAKEDFLEVFDLQMKQGRWFQDNRATDKNNIILNETAVNTFNIPKPIIGATIEWKGQIGQIIGIVADFNYTSLHQKIEPLLIHYNDGSFHNISVKVNGKNVQLALNKIEEKFAAHFPDILFEYAFLDDTYVNMHKAEAKMTLLFQIFACLLILISCLGLFGLATFAVERRTKEIGIRKILGANPRLIVQLISKDFLKLVAIALFVATPIAFIFMQNWLEDYPYRIEIQWWMFALVGILTMGLTFLTVGIQGIRAALQNPSEVLKNE